MRGFGDLTDLHVAMSLDEALLDLVAAFKVNWSWEVLGDPAALDALAEEIVQRWAGVQDVAAGSRGPHIDARVLETMEMLSGNLFGVTAGLEVRDPEGYWQADAVEAAYEQFLNLVKVQLILQVGGQFLFGASAGLYEFGTATLTRQGIDQAMVSELANIAATLADPNGFWMEVARIIAFAGPGDGLVPEQTAWLASAVSATTTGVTWQGFVHAVKTQLAAVNLLGTDQHDAQFGGPGHGFLTGLGGPDCQSGGGGRDALHGGAGDDEQYGGAGVDFLHGNEGDDTLMGEGGNDELYRGEDNDTYIWNPGDGADLIDETGGTDAIRFGPGIAPGDLSFNLDGYSLNVHVGGETLTLSGQFDMAGSVVERAEVANGSHLSLLGPFAIQGTPGLDYLQGFAGLTRILSGLEGDDELYGSDVNDLLDGGPGGDAL
ncbi:calcium-binding protein [Mameliella alba]|uniref:calcium-binding protein n=1 Tax=Mameliella alba TaxID=561184 RepID=UPI001055AE63|nr:calcium-binding protein [Mameliella alba]GGF64566.1 hypothetical protein GCM10011319_27000 [Mameliella alba]